MTFEIRAHTNGALVEASAEPYGRGYLVHLPAGVQRAGTAARAARFALDLLGPRFADADRTGKKWALDLEVGQISASFGEWPPELTRFRPRGRRPDPSSPLARIFRDWQRDPSAVRALDAAQKLIEQYAGAALAEAA